MEVTNINAFLSHYESIRSVTKEIIRRIPPDKMDWSYKPGKFSFGDLVRHIAAIERLLFAEVVCGRPVAYTGCGKELADGYENILAYFDAMHEQSVAVFKTLSDEDLAKSISAVGGRTTTVGNMLRALVIHEVHHRAALFLYLNLLDIPSPPVLGLTEEQVAAFGKKQNDKPSTL